MVPDPVPPDAGDSVKKRLENPKRDKALPGAVAVELIATPSTEFVAVMELKLKEKPFPCRIKSPCVCPKQLAVRAELEPALTIKTSPRKFKVSPLESLRVFGVNVPLPLKLFCEERFSVAAEREKGRERVKEGTNNQENEVLIKIFEVQNLFERIHKQKKEIKEESSRDRGA